MCNHYFGNIDTLKYNCFCVTKEIQGWGFRCLFGFFWSVGWGEGVVCPYSLRLINLFGLRIFIDCCRFLICSALIFRKHMLLFFLLYVPREKFLRVKTSLKMVPCYPVIKVMWHSRDTQLVTKVVRLF